MNALDLVKVGKAFGFAVPPRVNVNIGNGKNTTAKSQKKRRRDDEEGVQERNEDIVDHDGEQQKEETGMRRQTGRSKARRIEMNGRKMVGREVYRKTVSDGNQWSR